MTLRRLAVGALAFGSLTVGAAAPAVAWAPRSGDAPPTPTTAPASRGREIKAYLDELAVKLRAAPIDDAVRQGLLQRIAAARAVFAGGNVVPNGDMQALLRDVGLALGAGNRSDEHPQPTAPPTSPSSTASTVGHGDDHGRESAGEGARAELLKRLDALAARVAGSALPGADKTALADAIAALRARAAAGEPVAAQDVAALTARIARALGALAHHDDDGSDDQGDDGAPAATTTPGAGQPAATTQPAHHEGGGALNALDRAREIVDHANLDPEVRQRVLDAIDHAKGDAARDVGAGGDGHAAVQAYIDQRIAELRARLGAIATTLHGQLEEATAAHPDDAALAAAAATLAAADDALAHATTPAELRAVWAQLRQVRQAINAASPHEAEEPTTASTSTSTSTTMPSA